MPRKSNKKKPRNWDALNALLRRAPKFRHKTDPKGGSKNWRKDHAEKTENEG